MTNLASTAIMIVFAGGPHTPERTALACELLASQPPPAIIYLTGAEYRGEYSNLAAQVRSIASKLPTHPKVLTDTCTTTWASCRHLARVLSTDHRQPSTAHPPLTVITSNYHTPRVRWLLSSVLPSAHLTSHISRFTLITSPDIPWRQSLATSRNRQLILGECISWLYCFPLGLIYRPWWLAGTVFLLIGITLITRPTAT